MLGLCRWGRGFSSCGVWLLIAVSCCGAQALACTGSVAVVHSFHLLFAMCNLPRPGVEPMSPALAGGSLSIVPPKEKVLVTQLCLTLCDPMDCSVPGSSFHRIWNNGVGSHSLLQRIFPTHGNPGLLHCRQILYCLSPYCATREVLKAWFILNTSLCCLQLSQNSVNFVFSAVSRGPNPSKVLQQLLVLQPEQQLNIYKTLKTHLIEKGILQPTLKV